LRLICLGNTKKHATTATHSRLEAQRTLTWSNQRQNNKL